MEEKEPLAVSLWLSRLQMSLRSTRHLWHSKSLWLILPHNVLPEIPGPSSTHGSSRHARSASSDWYLVEELHGVVSDGASPVFGVDPFDVSILL